APIGTAMIHEVRSTDNQALDKWLKAQNVPANIIQMDEDNFAATDEVRTIVSSGPAANRIDLVFMGDGYTDNEREKFFADIKRLVTDMFIGQTFTAYLPLFNVHAVFRASNATGIGHGSPIDTAYGLYREGETLRAIFPSKQSAIRSSCGKAPGCDYPVVIANDPYYGGLGGEFAISTSSVSSGTIVLRHELGHNFGRVGEEYDGGGYFGANSSRSPSNVSWRHWASSNPVKAEPALARHLSWPWHKLDQGPFTADFKSDGLQAKTWIRLSASGIETNDTLKISFDGQDLPFASPNRLDRSFINIGLPGLSKGAHKLEFSEHVDDHNNWLSNLTVHEYGPDFHSENGFIGAFPVFAENLEVAGYRPTNEGCLMREMENPFFCPVCQENNWLNFFDKVSLIDSAKATKIGDSLNVKLTPVSLGQFRSGGTGPAGEHLEIRWYQGGVELSEYAGLTEWSRPLTSIGPNLEVRVQYLTSQIRKKTVESKQAIKLN
ncbi:MAG: M64 family metallo-endopeptidase, partial [Proteobacteria bacterium]|nr:M64 family metallo-endopeptidase [Pseudomonadota bacterium]